MLQSKSSFVLGSVFKATCTSQSEFSSFALKFGQYLDIQKTNTCLQIFHIQIFLLWEQFLHALDNLLILFWKRGRCVAFHWNWI